MNKSYALHVRRSLVALLLAVFVLATGPAWAQVGQSTLTGTVEDPTQAIIPGASVTLIDTSNQTARKATSDGRGFFSFSGLPAATYEVHVTANGFNPFVRKNVIVHIADQLDVPNIRLVPKTVAQTVTVTSESDEIVPTTSGEASYTISANQIQNLNIEGRSAIELLGLVPGAADSGNFNSDSYSGQVAGFTQNASAFSVNGNRFDQTQIVSDGAAVTDINTAGSAAVTPNVEMVQEAKVTTAAYSSEEPNGPIVVQTETKSGGKDFHGELYTTIRNHSLDDTDWRVKNLALPKPDDAYYYPGVNIGGPVLLPGTKFNHDRNKLFFFAGFEKDLQYVQDPLLDIRRAVTPDVCMRAGNYTGVGGNPGSLATTCFPLSDYSNSAYYASTVPCGTTPSGDNDSLCNGPGVINPAAIDPNGQILINALPLPNANPTATGGYNLVTAVTPFQPRDQENLKLDYVLNDANHLSVRYNHESESVPFPFGYYDNFTPNEYPGDQIGHNASNSIVANLSTAINSSMSNQLTFSYTRLNFLTDLNNEAAVSRAATGYNAPDLYNDGSDILPNVQPGYGDAGYASLYLPGGSYPTTNAPQQSYIVDDAVSKLYRTHLFKAGVYFVHQQFGQLTAGNENSTIITGDYNYAGNTGNSFADLLTGQIAGYSQSTANFVAHMNENRIDFFVQDAWKIRPNFSFNYGVRVNHIAPWSEANGRIVFFDPALYNPSGTYAESPGLVTHATDSSVPKTDGPGRGFQVAPSGGFAWDIHGNGSTIFRGGAGTNYYLDPGNNAFSTVEAPPNESFTQYYGITTISNIPNINTYLPLGAYGIGDLHDHRTPVTYSYNLALSQAVPKGIRVELAYTGNDSRNLTGYYETNAVPEGCAAELQYLIGYAPSSFNDVQCRPYSLLSGLSTETHNLSSFFNSMQVTASKSAGWVNFWATYTYGKDLADNCENIFDEHRCYGPAPYDRSQNLNISYFIHLPGASQHFGNSKVVGAFLDGWAISGIEQFSTGTPLQFTGAASANGNTGNEYDGIHNRTINFYGGSNFDNRTLVGTPDEQAVPTLVCNPLENLHAHQYFNAACFQAPDQETVAGQPKLGTYNLPYIHGPRYENDSLGLFKSFRLTETKRIEFRAQAFNVFNHPLDEFVQYDQGLYLQYYNTNPAPAGTPDYGTTYATLPSNSGPGGAGYATSKIGHRTLQLAGKFFF
jgi:hypothetical protein